MSQEWNAEYERVLQNIEWPEAAAQRAPERAARRAAGLGVMARYINRIGSSCYEPYSMRRRYRKRKIDQWFSIAV